MKQQEDNIATITRTRRETGFALIELLTAVAIIAVLIALLLPAIQKKRQEAAAMEATAEVLQAAAGANYYRNRTGGYPHTLAQLVQFVTSNPSPGISIDPRLASGRTRGYLYEIVEADQNHCKIEAEPEFPGITGSQTVTANARVLEDAIIVSFETPGSAEARERMFNQIRVKGAETVVKLLNQGFFDIPAELMVRSFVDEAMMSAGWIFRATAMDTNGDGRISIDEIRNYDDPNMDSALKGPLLGFMDYTDDACMFEILSEPARTNIGVSAGEIELTRGEQAPVLSYDGLCALTKTMIASDGLGVSGTLCAKLQTAKLAEQNGDLRARDNAVSNYKQLLEAEIGRSITRANANTIMAGRYGDGKFGLLDVLTGQVPTVSSR